MKDYYQTLNISMTASESEIEGAYRIMTNRYRRQATVNAAARSRLNEIKEAYGVLSNVVLRSEYDKRIINGNFAVKLTNVAYGNTNIYNSAQAPTTADMYKSTQATATADMYKSTQATATADMYKSTQATATAENILKKEKKPITVELETTGEKESGTQKIYKTKTYERDGYRIKTGERERAERREKARKEKELAASIRESSLAMQKAYEKVSRELAEKRKQNQGNEADKQQEDADTKKEDIKNEKNAAEKRQRIVEEINLKREQIKREREEREAIMNARKEAARLANERAKRFKNDKPTKTVENMQSLLNNLTVMQAEREAEDALRRQKEEAEERKRAAAAPVVVMPTTPAPYARQKEVGFTEGAKREIALIKRATEREIAQLKSMWEDERKETARRFDEQARVMEEMRKLINKMNDNGLTVEQNERKLNEIKLKISEAEASAEKAAAQAALRAAEALNERKLKEEAQDRLEAAIKEKENVAAAVERERQERQRMASIANSARAEAVKLQGEREQARRENLKSKIAQEKMEAEIQSTKKALGRTEREAAELKQAKAQSEKELKELAEARKLSEEKLNRERDNAVKLSERLNQLKTERAEAEKRAAEADRLAKEAAAAQAEKERLSATLNRSREELAAVSERLKITERSKRELDEKLAIVKLRRENNAYRNENIAKQISDWENFKNTFSEASMEKLVAEWEAKVHSDIIIFKKTYYGTLGVPYWATVNEIKDAADRLTEIYTARDSDDRFEKLSAIEVARTVLTDTESRNEYNERIGLKMSEIASARQAKACYEEIIEKIANGKRVKEFWDQFDKLSYDAQAGDAEAQNRLGEAYSDGVEVPVDREKAVYWLKEAAKQLNPKAMFNLGMCFLNGDGVERDELRGKGFIKKAALLGHKGAIGMCESPEFKRR